MEAGAASLQIDKFNFADFIDETVEPLEIADAGHAHNIEIHVPDDIEMEGDQDRLRQLFTNIIANALKHSADNTAVLIEAHENKDFGTIVTNVVNFGSQIPQKRGPISSVDSSKARRDQVPNREEPVLDCQSPDGRRSCMAARYEWWMIRAAPISKSLCRNITFPMTSDDLRRQGLPAGVCQRQHGNDQSSL